MENGRTWLQCACRSVVNLRARQVENDRNGKKAIGFPARGFHESRHLTDSVTPLMKAFVLLDNVGDSTLFARCILDDASKGGLAPLRSWCP